MARFRVTGAVAVFAALLAITLVSVGRAQAGGSSPLRSVAGLSSEASFLSGRTVSLGCAATRRQWARELTAVGLPGADADRHYGFSVLAEGRLHLSPYVCQGLELGSVASTRRSNELQVAWAVDVLIHESVHLRRLTSDERLAEACARIGLPAELHRLYGIAYGSAEMLRLTRAAALFRSTQGPAYRGGTCPTPAA